MVNVISTSTISDMKLQGDTNMGTHINTTYHTMLCADQSRVHDYSETCLSSCVTVVVTCTSRYYDKLVDDIF